MSKHTARTVAFQLIYEQLLAMDGVREEETFDTLCTEAPMPIDDFEKTYIRNTTRGVFEHIEELKATIAGLAIGFDIGRIYKVDLSILLLALYELTYDKKIPTAVVCNEAVELAKEFSTIKSPSYINGILAQAAKRRE